ncbi:MAG: hypothetical protein HQK51_08660 [Oligoflexia bacterium]|nr:hypothetical protein [Oligoflexia bacterium]
MNMIHVFGAINLDVIVQKDKFLTNTSNISKIDLNFGGVGFNIFQSLKTKQKKFITTIGDDLITPYLEKFLKKFKDQCKFYINRQYTNGKYVALMEEGRLIYGAADVIVVEKGFSKNFLDTQIKKVKNNDFVIIDANLGPSTISYIIKSCSKKKAKIIFETVSVEKTQRSRKILKNLFLISPTEEELLAAISSSSSSEMILNKSVLSFMKKSKIENIILTKGEKGVEWFYKDKEDLKYLVKKIPPKKIIRTKNTTGAGDLLLASIVSNLKSITNNNFANFDNSNNFERAITLAMKTVEQFLQKRK